MNFERIVVSCLFLFLCFFFRFEGGLQSSISHTFSGERRECVYLLIPFNFFPLFPTFVLPRIHPPLIPPFSSHRLTPPNPYPQSPTSKFQTNILFCRQSK